MCEFFECFMPNLIRCVVDLLDIFISTISNDIFRDFILTDVSLSLELHCKSKK